MTNCILCQRALSATDSSGLYIHEEAEDCLVRVADRFGISLDEEYKVVGDNVWHRQAPQEQTVIDLAIFKSIEEALTEIFAEVGLDRLGGRSSGSGWSNVGLFQRCAYAWKRTYRARRDDELSLIGEIVPLAVGSLTHTYLALHYQRMIVHDYPLVPEDVNRRVRELGCNPEVFTEAWRLFYAYRLYYQTETLIPLAIEHNAIDPRTGHSCRYDLIAYFPDEVPGRLPGTYVVEFKTAARFDQNTIEGWVGDGEILGQVDLWQRLHLDRRFGPLRGVIVSLLGKQKVPEFHRTVAAPTSFAIEQHRKDLRYWNAAIQTAIATDVFPRSRNNCINRYGRCGHWDHCNLGE